MTVEDLLKKKKLEYRHSGNDYLIKCLNPEHDDNNPSMRVDKVLGIFNCLACGYKGNLFYKYNVAFDKGSILRETLKRKIQDIRSNSIGLALPSTMYPVTEAFRVSLDTLLEFEAFRSIGPDYEGRIVFPIRDLKGRIACFIGRTEQYFTDKSRYKVFPSGCKPPLFPLHKVKPHQGRVILVEGLFDMLNLYDNGFRNVLCTFGTNTVTSSKLQLLKLLGISGIDIIFDPDEAGIKAAEEIKELAEEEYFNTRVIKLKKDDPGAMGKESVLKLWDKLYCIDTD